MSLHGNEAPAQESTGATESTEPACRICYRGTGGSQDEGSLVVPCSCRGSVGFTHKKCLEQWLRQRDTDQCDVCLYRFTLRCRTAPLWYFFRNPDHQRDIIRILVNVASCVGDVMVLVFAVTYVSGFLGSVDWLTYLIVMAVLLFQTVFSITVEVIRAVYAEARGNFGTCSQPVRKWRKRTAYVELLLHEGDGSSSTERPETLPSVTPLAILTVHTPILLVASVNPENKTATTDHATTEPAAVYSAKGSISADNSVTGTRKEERKRAFWNTL